MTNPPVVLYVVHTAKIGGAAQSLYTFLKHRDPKRFSAIVWCGEDGEYVSRFRELGLPTYVGRMFSLENHSHFSLRWSSDAVYNLLGCLINTLPTFLWMGYFVYFKKVSLVHINSTTPLLCGVLARACGIPVVWHVREIFGANIWQGLQRRVIVRSSSVIVAISDRVARDYAGKGAGKVKVIHNPFELKSPDDLGGPLSCQRCGDGRSGQGIRCHF